MRFVDVIARKRDGAVLSRDEIEYFVTGVTTGGVPDYQAAALLMAIFLQGMTHEETAWLTQAMVSSGERVDLSDIPGVKVGKHSTGGVGDKVSIVLAPLAAACGVVVPKMSGRGLGHTGGTLDKLESIPGYRIHLTIDEFKRVLATVGASIIGQTEALAPADRTLYALRDVTGTIASVPLVASSIMSKKLAEGSNALVLDVKCGDGAFMKHERRARELAEAMVAIASHAGVRAEAVITDMEAPLGRAVGNALELVECLETLSGAGPDDLTHIVKHLAARMLIVGGVQHEQAAAIRCVEAAMASGRARETFARMVEAHGGNPRIVDDYTLLPSVAGRERVRAPRAGFVTALRAEAIGHASNALGAGRTRLEDSVDHAVGVVISARLGEAVKEGDVLMELHHRDGRGLEAARALCRQAVRIGDDPPAHRAPVLGEVR
jgi:pyrimidine-nucleoside phosphorylase/thymidine phosphorylase